MMTALATVSHVEAFSEKKTPEPLYKVSLSCQQKTSCSACSSQKSCATGQISKALGNREHIWFLVTEKKVNQGDVVEIGFPEGKLLSSAALVYLVPLLALFNGAMIGQAWLAPLLGGGELMTIISALLFSGLGAITVKRYLQQNEQDDSHQVSLIRTLGESIELK
jgi:sigma-E factor negative regulatory protein RseC